MKKSIVLTFIFILVLSAFSFAQNRGDDSYRTAIGAKFFPGAISFKQRISGNNYFEGLAYSWRGTRFTGLYELHYDIGGLDGLKWYVGPGAHISFYSEKNYGGASYIGLDGVLGLDYKIGKAPLNLSIDWQPSFDFRSYDAFNGGFGGLSVRYIIR